MSARPTVVAVSQNTSSDTGHPCREKVGTGAEVSAGEGLEALGGSADGDGGSTSADPQAITPTSIEHTTTDHLNPYSPTQR
jgi:hypothetical protein